MFCKTLEVQSLHKAPHDAPPAGPEQHQQEIRRREPSLSDYDTAEKTKSLTCFFGPVLGDSLYHSVDKDRLRVGKTCINTLTENTHSSKAHLDVHVESLALTHTVHAHTLTVNQTFNQSAEGSVACFW